MSSPQVFRNARHHALGLRHASSTTHNSQNNSITPAQRRRPPPVLPPSQAWSSPKVAPILPKVLKRSSSNRGNGGRPPPPPPPPSQSNEPPQKPREQNEALARTLATVHAPDLVVDVRIGDDRDAVLPLEHPAMSILGHSSLVIQRQLEMMNVIMGFEEANRYIIMDGKGQTVGYMAERDHGLGQSMARQVFRTHRSFTTHIFDKQQREVLRIHRPFSYINSRIRIYDAVPKGGFPETDTETVTTPAVAQEPAAMSTSIMNHSVDAALTAPQISPLELDNMPIIGESQQQWAAFRRKYNLFSWRPLEPSPSSTSDTKLLESGQKATSESIALTEAKASDAAIEKGMSQFAHIDERILSWDFTLRSADDRTIGSVNRNFSGFAREIFTDTGVYALRMDSAAENASAAQQQQSTPDSNARTVPMSLDARAVMLATAISIDFDYFSVNTGGIMPSPMFWPMPGVGGGGGGASEGTDSKDSTIGAGAATGAEGAEGVGYGAQQGMFGDDAAAGQDTFIDDEADNSWDDLFDGGSPSSSGPPPEDAGEDSFDFPWSDRGGGPGEGGSGNSGGSGGSGGGGDGGGGGGGGGSIFDVFF